MLIGLNLVLSCHALLSSLGAWVVWQKDKERERERAGLDWTKLTTCTFLEKITGLGKTLRFVGGFHLYSRATRGEATLTWSTLWSAALKKRFHLNKEFLSTCSTFKRSDATKASQCFWYLQNIQRCVNESIVSNGSQMIVGNHPRKKKVAVKLQRVRIRFLHSSYAVVLYNAIQWNAIMQ